MKRPRRYAAAALFVLLALPMAPASAHAAYKESNPANKSSVPSPPSEVWADFTEPPAQSSRLEIYDPCGERVDSGSWNITAYRITGSMSSDKKGTYTARFYVTSDLDSHVTTGSFTFTSTGGVPCPGAAEAPPKPSEEKPSGSGGTEDGGSDAGGDADTATGSGATEGPSGAAAADGTADKPGRHKGMNHGGKKKGKADGQRNQDGEGREPKDKDRSSASGPPVGDDEESPSSGEIPMDWLMISFGIAGAVGAAGGKVYAGLMGGPRA